MGIKKKTDHKDIQSGRSFHNNPVVAPLHCVIKNTAGVILPLMVQLRAHTTCPSGSTVWFGGKLRLTVKVAFAPVRVGASFLSSKVTSPPTKKYYT